MHEIYDSCVKTVSDAIFPPEFKYVIIFTLAHQVFPQFEEKTC